MRLQRLTAARRRRGRPPLPVATVRQRLPWRSQRAQPRVRGASSVPTLQLALRSRSSSWAPCSFLAWRRARASPRSTRRRCASTRASGVRLHGLDTGVRQLRGVRGEPLLFRETAVLSHTGPPKSLIGAKIGEISLLSLSTLSIDPFWSKNINSGDLSAAFRSTSAKYASIDLCAVYRSCWLR